jgi:hypothetical protein
MTQDPKIYLQFRETDLITWANRRRRERRGLEAIFTSQKEGLEIEILTGAAGVLAGLVLSILSILPTNNPLSLEPSTNAVYLSLAFGALGVLLLTCGGGTVAFALSNRESRLSNPTASPVEGQSKANILGDTEGRNEPQRMFGLGSRIGAVAFVQSLVLVVLYSGFVQEYESNSTMQIWVRSNFPIAQSVLNWEGVLILSVFLGVLLLQFLPRRFFSEE